MATTAERIGWKSWNIATSGVRAAATMAAVTLARFAIPAVNLLKEA